MSGLVTQRRMGRAAPRVLVLLAMLTIAFTTPGIPARGDAAPQMFASEPNQTWGTSPSEDPTQAGKEKAGRVAALAEVGSTVFVAGRPRIGVRKLP